MKCRSLSSNPAERGPQEKGINVSLPEKSGNSVFIHFSTKAADFEKKIDRKPRSKKIFLSSKEFLMESHFQKKSLYFHSFGLKRVSSHIEPILKDGN